MVKFLSFFKEEEIIKSDYCPKNQKYEIIILIKVLILLTILTFIKIIKIKTYPKVVNNVIYFSNIFSHICIVN